FVLLCVLCCGVLPSTQTNSLSERETEYDRGVKGSRPVALLGSTTALLVCVCVTLCVCVCVCVCGCRTVTTNRKHCLETVICHHKKKSTKLEHPSFFCASVWVCVCVC